MFRVHCGLRALAVTSSDGAHENASYCDGVLNERRELICETAKAKEEEESMRKAHGKYMVEVNSLHRRLKHAKEWKEEAEVFEQLQKLW